MNTLDKQYTDLLQDILDNGVRKPNRTGVDTISVFGRQIRHKMSEGFPILTTKKVAFKQIVTELLWFLSGNSNIQSLVKDGNYIWVGDAYKRYEKDVIKSHKENGLEGFDYLNKDSFIERIETDDEFAKIWGDVGRGYGAQWRSWKFTDKFTDGQQIMYVNGKIDQIQNLINTLKTNPDDRRMLVTAWNPAELDKTLLPPCHYGFQVYTRELSARERTAIGSKGSTRLYDSIKEENYKTIDVDSEMHKVCDEAGVPKRAISLMWNQRSVDTPLGLPFNIASYGLLLLMLADEVNMVPDELIGNLGDTHIYVNQIEGVKEQIGRDYTYEERTAMLIEIMGYELYTKAYNDTETFPFGGGMSEFFDLYKIPERTREPYPLPTVHVRDGIYCSSVDDIILENYQSHTKINFPLSN